MSDEHTTVSGDNEYEVTFHPAFASRCTVGGKQGPARDLYVQSKAHRLNGKALPKRHQIRLKGKKGKRDITVTLDDPNHSIARIHVELYPESHDRNSAKSAPEGDLVFTVENHARVCPPICDE